MRKSLSILNLILALVLLVPSVSVVVAAPQNQAGQDYVLQAGDSLAALAEQHLGSADAVVAIIGATNDKWAADNTYTPVVDPAAVRAGAKVYIPTKDEAAKYTAALPDLQGRKLRVGSDTTYPPFEYPDEKSGQPIGFDVEMVQDLCKRLNCVIDIVPTAYDGIFVALAAKEFDMVVSGSTITAEREEIVDFSNPYMVYGQILLIQSEAADTIKDVESAKGKPIGSQLGTTNEKTGVDLFGDANVKRYDTFDLAVVALLNGDVDGVVIDLPSAVGFMKQYPGKMAVGPELTTGEALGMVFQPGDNELRTAVNSALNMFKADGGYTTLYNKYFNVSVDAAAAPDATTTTTTTTTSSVEPTGTLVVGTTDKLSVFDPADVYDFHAWEIWHNTGDGLLNATPGTAGEVEPGLAEKYEVSADGKTYTFTLRKGVTFPDGKPLTAQDVKASIDRVIKMNADLGGEVAFLVSDYVASVDVVDDSTVKIVTTQAYGFFPKLVASNPYKIVDVAKWSMDKYDADNIASGIGPFVVTSWKRDEEMVLEANPTYYGAKPKVAKIIIRYFADSSTMRLALENGEIDIAWKSLAPADLKSLEGKAGIKVEKQPGTEIRYVCYNAKTAPFDNAKVRTALAMMLDREEIADVGFQGNKVPLYSMVPPGFLGHAELYGDADVEGAKTLLADAGFTADKPLTFDFWYSPTHYGDTEADVAAIIKDQWEKSGVIKVNMQNAEWATFKEYRNKGSMPVFLLGWYPDYTDTDDYTYPFAHTGATDGLGIFYSNPEMDKLLEAAQIETDEAKRVDLYKQIQQLWTTENSTTPFAQGALTVAYKDNVTGIVLDPLALFHYFLVEKPAQ